MELYHATPYIASKQLILRNLLCRECEKTFGEADATSPGTGQKAKKRERKYMSEFQESAYTNTTPRWVGLAVAVLGGISLLGLGVSWSAARWARSSRGTTMKSISSAAWGSAITSSSPCNARAVPQRSAAFRSN